MNKEIKEIIDSLEQTVSWCDRITTGNLPHKIGNLKQGLFYAIELLKVLNLGWHPAGELPPEEGEYIVLSLPDMYGSTDVFYAEYRQPYGWCYEIEGHYAKINIQKWCYPPQND